MIDLLDSKILKRLEALQLKSRKSFLGSRQGQHRSIRKGHGLEFDDHRSYAPGDDYRHIDWAVYGRTDRIYIKQFREEQDLSVSILVDSSKSMVFTEEKFSYSKSLGLALSYTALNNGDNVSFTFLGNEKRIPKISGIKLFNRLVKQVEETKTVTSFTWQNAIRSAMQSKRSPGICYLISDFLCELDPVFTSLDFLRAKGFELSLIQIQDEQEVNFKDIGSFNVADSETGETIELSLDSSSLNEYKKIYNKHFELLELYCRKSNINLIPVTTNEKLGDVLFDKFLNKGLIG